MNRDYYIISWVNSLSYTRNGKKELALKFEDDRFLQLRNCNNKFKKHLGFTVGNHKIVDSKGVLTDYECRITIYDKSKLMLFRIKYGL